MDLGTAFLSRTPDADSTVVQSYTPVDAEHCTASLDLGRRSSPSLCECMLLPCIVVDCRSLALHG